jgi:hypothetical protein
LLRRSISSLVGFLPGAVNSNYHAVSAKVTRRMSAGLTFMTGYTFSKSIDDSSSIRTLGSDQLKPQARTSRTRATVTTGPTPCPAPA